MWQIHLNIKKLFFDVGRYLWYIAYIFQIKNEITKSNVSTAWSDLDHIR